MGDSNITSTRRKPSKKVFRHSTSVDLTHSMVRQKKEDLFGTELHKAFEKVSDDLDLKLDPCQLYNCISLVEMMRRTKGIVICGPMCSGKTQLIKFVTLALKSQFNVQMRTSFLNSGTFTEQELYGPVFAFEQDSIQNT